MQTPSATGERRVLVRISIFTATLGLIMCTMTLAAGAPSKPQTHTVIIEGMRFQPEELTVAPGDTVVWVNNDLVPRTATSKTGNFDSKDIQAEKSWRHTTRKTGDFAYICTFHPTMKAILRVK
jgi:plastocyanin